MGSNRDMEYCLIIRKNLFHYGKMVKRLRYIMMKNLRRFRENMKRVNSRMLSRTKILMISTNCHFMLLKHFHSSNKK